MGIENGGSVGIEQARSVTASPASKLEASVSTASTAARMALSPIGAAAAALEFAGEVVDIFYKPGDYPFREALIKPPSRGVI